MKGGIGKWIGAFIGVALMVAVIHRVPQIKRIVIGE